MSLPVIPHKAFFDWGAVGIALGSWLDHLPSIAAAFSIIWLGLQIYDWIAKKFWRKSNRRKGE